MEVRENLSKCKTRLYHLANVINYVCRAFMLKTMNTHKIEGRQTQKS